MSFRSVIDWNREAGRKAAAVSLALRVVGLVIPVRLLDENLLPFAASSACGIYITQWKDRNQSLSHKHVHTDTVDHSTNRGKEITCNLSLLSKC